MLVNKVAKRTCTMKNDMTIRDYESLKGKERYADSWGGSINFK